MKKEKYAVTGMTCSACSARVEKCVKKVEGVNSVSVNLLTNSMQVEYDESVTKDETIIAAVVDAGYGAALMSGKGGVKEDTESRKKAFGGGPQSEDKQMKKRLIWSVGFLAPMMLISMSHMFHMWGLPYPKWFQNIFWGTENGITFAFAQFLLLLPVMYLNRKYYIAGFKNLFRGSPNMDSLIAVGSGASALYGVFAIFRIGYGLGHGNMELAAQYSNDLYFESAAMILTLITVGKYLESRSKKKTSRALEKLMDLAPKQAVVERDGRQYTIPVEQIVAGDIFLVKPGEGIAVDGVILEGTTSVDQSAITGESIPVEKRPGDTVVSAALNKTGFIRVRAVKVGEDTTINRIIALVEEASQSKAPIARLADRISGVFVPVVMAIALAAAVIWGLSGAGFEFALSVGIAVLVISCPCALGLATPVAIMVGTGKGAENGILIKSGEALETAHSIDTVVLDKTGTVTEGRPRVTDVYSCNVTEEELLGIACGMEERSEHPLAEAIAAYGVSRNIVPAAMSDFQAVFGKGIRAALKTEETGKAAPSSDVCLAGNEALMKENGVDILAVSKTAGELADEGKTPMFFARGGKLIGIIAVADVEKATSLAAIQAFRAMHIDVVMLTGDNKRTAEAVQRRLNIPHVIAQVLPEDKERHIARLQEQGHKVAMIGDGINDAPALARADLGIAIGAGTDVAIESADAVLMRNDLLDAVSAIKLSKSVIRNIKENLFWAFFYNSIGIPLAAGALYPAFHIKLSPMFGAAAMSLSSICVVTNALRLRRLKLRERAVSQKKLYFPQSRDIIVTKENGQDFSKREENHMTTVLKVEGMMCGHCKAHVEKALSGMEGVLAVSVSLEDKTATVTTDREIAVSEYETVIKDAGYELVK